MGINYEEPYCQGISFYGELPVELDPNAIEYLPLKLLDTLEEAPPIKVPEPSFDKSVPTTSDENLIFLAITADGGNLYNGLWLPELNGYSFNNSTHLEGISKDISNFGENPGGSFHYNSLPYISSSHKFNDVSKLSDDQVFFTPQNVTTYPANYNSNADQTEPPERVDVYTVLSESSDYTNQNLWLPYNSGYAQNSQPFPNQATFYKEPVFIEMPQNAIFQNAPCQTYINGNFNTVNVPNNYVPNNFVPINFIANNYAANSLVHNNVVPNNYVANSFVPNNVVSNNYVPANYVPTSYVQVDNSNTFEIPAPVKEFTYKNPTNSEPTNASSQVYSSTYKGETQVRPKITRNSASNSGRRSFPSRTQSNKGYNVVPNNPNEKSFRFNNQQAAEFPSNSKDNHTRPPYVREFAKCMEGDSRPTNQQTTKFHDRSLSRKHKEHNQSHNSSRSLNKSHPYKQPSKDKEADKFLTITDRQLKENVSDQTSNSTEISFLSKAKQEEAKLCGGLTSSKQPGSPSLHNML